jgi:hypothetical protein
MIQSRGTRKRARDDGARKMLPVDGSAKGSDPMRRHRSWTFRRVAGRLATVVLAALVSGIPAFCSDISKAIDKGDLEKVKALLKENPELISKKGGGILNETPLQNALESDQMAIAKFLLSQGADVLVKDRSGDTVVGTTHWYSNYRQADLLQLFVGKAGKADLTPLMTAALLCDGSGVAAALQQGADVNARDSAGNDALSFAAVSREKDLSLQCPDVVSALVKAGADPRKARYYQVPDFEQHKPSRIAVLRVEDIRGEMDEKSNLAEKFAQGIEHTLSQANFRGTAGLQVKGPHYPVMTLRETRDKLTAAGFQSDDPAHPDRKRACAALGVDAVLEAVVKDYGHGMKIGERVGLDVAVGVTHSEASLEYWLSDCRSGELMWKSDPGPVEEKRGFIEKAWANGFTRICEQTITLPRFDEPGRKSRKR